MPTYDYRCSECTHEFEDFESITARPRRDCPKCGKPEARRQISGSSFILRGGGWAKDLYSKG